MFLLFSWGWEKSTKGWGDRVESGYGVSLGWSRIPWVSVEVRMVEVMIMFGVF
jgi:hypothetical protein